MGTYQASIAVTLGMLMMLSCSYERVLFPTPTRLICPRLSHQLEQARLATTRCHRVIMGINALVRLAATQISRALTRVGL